MYTSTIAASLLSLFASTVLSIPTTNTSPNPKHLHKRTYPDFDDWPPGTEADKQKIIDALPDAIDLAAVATSDFSKYEKIYGS